MTEGHALGAQVTPYTLNVTQVCLRSFGCYAFFSITGGNEQQLSSPTVQGFPSPLALEVRQKLSTPHFPPVFTLWQV